jgi:hypothetical protein
VDDAMIAQVMTAPTTITRNDARAMISARRPMATTYLRASAVQSFVT